MVRRLSPRLRATRTGVRVSPENVFHVGAPGAGHVIKLLNNFIAQAICTATAGGVCRRQKKAGVDLRKLVELISAGVVNNGLFQRWRRRCPAISAD